MFNLGALQIWYQSQVEIFLWDIEYGVKILRNWLVRHEDYYDIIGDL